MKKVIIGSHAYKNKMNELKEQFEAEGHEVRLPAMDYHPEWNEFEICRHNLELVKWGDMIHMIWDRRSMGTVFDFGMIFALEKDFKIEYLEPKTMENVMKMYEKWKNVKGI